MDRKHCFRWNAAMAFVVSLLMLVALVPMRSVAEGAAEDSAESMAEVAEQQEGPSPVDTEKTTEITTEKKAVPAPVVEAAPASVAEVVPAPAEDKGSPEANIQPSETLENVSTEKVEEVVEDDTTTSEEETDEEEGVAEEAEELPVYVPKVAEIGGAIAWAGVPEGAEPSVTLNLGGGDGVAREAIVLHYGGTASYSFGELPIEDGEANAYAPYTVAASATEIEGYDCDVSRNGYSVSVRYAQQEVEAAVETTSASGAVAWANVPDGAAPSVTITLGGGDGVARQPIVCSYGNGSYSFAELPSEDAEGNVYPAYTISATADGIEGYDCTVSYDGYAVNVSYSLNQQTLEAIQAVNAAIDAYPSVETIAYMDPTGTPYANAIRDYETIQRMLSAIPASARAEISGLARMEDATLVSYILGA